MNAISAQMRKTTAGRTAGLNQSRVTVTTYSAVLSAAERSFNAYAKARIITAGIIPLIPIIAVAEISASENPWIRMMMPSTNTASINASSGFALPSITTAPIAKPTTVHTGKKKFQKRLVLMVDAG